jgi:hypothetical protein
LGSGTLRSTEKTAAASVDEADEDVCGSRRHRHADAHADGGEHRGRRHRPADLLPLGVQAAFGQDQHQGGVAQHLGELGIVELHAEAVLPDDDADAQIEQEAGQSAAGGQPDRRHGDEQDERTDQKELVEVVDSQGPLLPRENYFVCVANNLPLLEYFGERRLP